MENSAKGIDNQIVHSLSKYLVKKKKKTTRENQDEANTIDLVSFCVE